MKSHSKIVVFELKHPVTQYLDLQKTLRELSARQLGNGVYLIETSISNKDLQLKCRTHVENFVSVFSKDSAIFQGPRGEAIGTSWKPGMKLKEWIVGLTESMAA
jgi:hypothetical protein